MMDDKLVDVFVKESQLHMEAIKSNLRDLQKNIEKTDANVLNGIFRAIHSIKGASGFYHFSKISTLSFKMENLLSQLRYGKIELSHGLIGAFLTSVELLNGMLNDVSKSDECDIEDGVAQLEQYLKRSDIPAIMVKLQEQPRHGQRAKSFEIAEEKVEEIVKKDQSFYSLKFSLKKDLTHNGKTPFDLINTIDKSGEFIESSLDIDNIQGLSDCLDNDLAFVVLFASGIEDHLLPFVLDIPRGQIFVIDMKEARIRYGLEAEKDLNPTKDTLFLTPEIDLVASKIEALRDSFLAKLKSHPSVLKVVFKADNVDVVDSLGVNLIIGIYRQVKSESKEFEITGAGQKFMKVANFFQFPSLFSVKGKD